MLPWNLVYTNTEHVPLVHINTLYTTFCSESLKFMLLTRVHLKELALPLSLLYIYRVVGGAVADGAPDVWIQTGIQWCCGWVADHSWPLGVLGRPNCRHPPGHGGSVCLPPRTPTTLVLYNTLILYVYVHMYCMSQSRGKNTHPPNNIPPELRVKC